MLSLLISKEISIHHSFPIMLILHVFKVQVFFISISNMQTYIVDGRNEIKIFKKGSIENRKNMFFKAKK